MNSVLEEEGKEEEACFAGATATVRVQQCADGDFVSSDFEEKSEIPGALRDKNVSLQGHVSHPHKNGMCQKCFLNNVTCADLC